MSESNISLVIRLGYLQDVDFFDEHKKIIEKNGFVDMCVFTRRNPNMAKYNKSLFVKEAKNSGDRLFRAKIEGIQEFGEKYPDYYKKFDLTNRVWIRISQIDVVDFKEFIEEYKSLSGKSIQSIFKSSTTLFGVHN